MKILSLVTLLVATLAISTFAQNTPSKTSPDMPQAVAPGCGQHNFKFKVKIDKKQHPFPQAATGKVLVYFIQDNSEFRGFGAPTTRAGIDGVWLSL